MAIIHCLATKWDVQPYFSNIQPYFSRENKMIPCFECISKANFEELIVDGQVMTKDQWCVKKQESGECELHKTYIKSFDDVNPKRVKGIEVCKGCCNKDGKSCGSGFVNSEIMGMSKRMCPLTRKWFSTNEKRMAECKYKVIMATESLI